MHTLPIRFTGAPPDKRGSHDRRSGVLKPSRWASRLRWAATAVALAVTLAAAVALALVKRLPREPVLPTSNSPYINSQIIFHELTLPSPDKVPQYFGSFARNYALAEYDPEIGFYSNWVRIGMGRGTDFRTQPIEHSPEFGQALAEQVFCIWRAWRASGKLKPSERFYIVEYGPGTGRMAHDIVNHIADQASDGRRGWADFYDQLQYIGIDVSPSLREQQTRHMALHADHFRAIAGDAMERFPLSLYRQEAVVVLGNELLDALPLHKVRMTAMGRAEVAHVVTYLPGGEAGLQALPVSAALKARIREADRVIRSTFDIRERTGHYLTQEVFEAVLHSYPTRRSQEFTLPFVFREVYIPLRYVPDLETFIQRHADQYAGILSILNTGAVFHIAPGVADVFETLQQLERAYVIQIDYGHSALGLAQVIARAPLFRTFPRGEAEMTDVLAWQNPYRGFARKDMTADVSWWNVVEEAKRNGFEMTDFRRQAAIALGIDIPRPEGKEGSLAGRLDVRFQVVGFRRGDVPPFHFVKVDLASPKETVRTYYRPVLTAQWDIFAILEGGRLYFESDPRLDSSKLSATQRTRKPTILRNLLEK